MQNRTLFPGDADNFMGIATVERWQRVQPRTPISGLDFLKRSPPREIYKLDGIGHLFTQHLVRLFSGKSLKLLLPPYVIFYS